MGIYPPPKLGHLRRRDVLDGSKLGPLTKISVRADLLSKPDITADILDRRLGAIDGHRGRTQTYQLLGGVVLRRAGTVKSPSKPDDISRRLQFP